jgi:delta1-piperideine-2-carboxylate reductase
MMIELLVAGLSGQDFSFEAQKNDNNDGGPPNGGELMLAIDPTKFGDSDKWLTHSESFLQLLGGMDGAHIPADRRYKNRRENSKNGISVKASVHNACVEFAK